MVKKVKTNKFSLNNGEKFMESKTGLQRSTDDDDDDIYLKDSPTETKPWSRGSRSCAVLVRRSFKTRDLSGAVVYFTTQYNVHNDNRQTGHLLSALRLERCTVRHYFSHNKMAQKITK